MKLSKYDEGEELVGALSMAGENILKIA